MPVYEIKVDGSDKPRMVKAATPAAARNHVARAVAISAERMSELIDDGIALEKAEAQAETVEGEEGEK
jgi:cob(I)alamin adenosyltransferase